MEKRRVIPKGIAWPFILLTCLFFAWAIPNNLTDTMLAAFKRIMSLSDSRTAWIQVVCYLLGYGCCAIPGAMFIKRYTYKAGVLLGLGLYAFGTFLFYPAMLCSSVNIDFSFIMFLLAIFVLFSGLSVLETSANSYVLMMGDEQTATQRLNFAQSFNPFGAITGVVISQVFILSQLNLLTSSERAALPMDELTAIQGAELNAVTTTYVILGLVMLAIMLAIRLTRMPSLKEAEEKVDFGGTFRRLVKNKNYVWGIVAQFFYVGAQIAVWSFVIRYAMQQLHFDTVVASLASDAPTASVISALRDVEPVAGKFYDLCERIGLDDLLPRTAEQAGATYYILSLILFVTGRFACTGLMRFFKPRNILTALALLLHYYLRSGSFGRIRSDGDLRMHVDYVPDNLWVRAERPRRRYQDRRCRHGYGHRGSSRPDSGTGHRIRSGRQHQNGLLGSRSRIHGYSVLQHCCLS